MNNKIKFNSFLKENENERRKFFNFHISLYLLFIKAYPPTVRIAKDFKIL